MSEQAEIVPLNPGRRMSEAEYDRERERLRETYGNSRTDAANRWEQELALLFCRSGWTQDALAIKEGKTQPWVTYRLRFGRFLAYSENITTVINLSERAFRKYWDETDSKLVERDRFRGIVRVITAEDVDTGERKAKLRAIGEAARDRYADGKWHNAETIANYADADIEDVVRVMHNMVSNTKPSRYKAESRRQGKGFQFRVFKSDRTVATSELEEKLRPLINELRAQAKTNMATVAIGVFGQVAHRLDALLEEWSQ